MKEKGVYYTIYGNVVAYDPEEFGEEQGFDVDMNEPVSVCLINFEEKLDLEVEDVL